MCDDSCTSVQALSKGTDRFTWVHVPIALDTAIPSSDLLAQFRSHLAPHARPQWRDSSTQLGLKVYADGMTNVVIGVFDEGASEDQDGGIVLLRIFGKCSELFINREREVFCMLQMHLAGYAPPLYCRFVNGLCCGFLPGRCISVSEMGEPRMLRRIAVCMAQVHSVQVITPAISKRAVLWDMFDWILRVPASFNDAEKDRRFSELFGTLDALKDEGERLKQVLSSLQSPLVFSHNDVQAKNLIYCSHKDTVNVIDYEYAGMNFAAFDLGNFFCEFSGAEELDFSRYPDERVQKSFIKIYLEEGAKLRGEDPSSVSDEQIHTWYMEAARCALASHLVWTYWGLLQAAHSVLKIDFLRYSYIRFMEYQKRKDEVYSLS